MAQLLVKLVQPGTARSDDPPPERAAENPAASFCATGPLLVTLGAALFAVTNAASTGLYRRGGTVVTLYLIRAVVVYAANGALTCARDGRAEACRVLQLRTGKVETSRLAVARGLVTAAMALLLNLAFLLLTFNDAFTVFKGVDMLATVVLSRALLGAAERLSPAELACGMLTLSGIVLVAQPSMLGVSRDGAAAASTAAGAASAGAAAGAAAGTEAVVSVAGVSAAGVEGVVGVSAARVVLAAMAGVLSACSGVSTRALSARDGPHAGHAPPAMLLSYLLVTMGACFGAIAIGAHASHLDALPRWSWSALAWPSTSVDWALICVHCSCVLAAQAYPYP